MENSVKKSVAATTGAVLTSLVVTPLDVAKARLQAQILPRRSFRRTLSSSSFRRGGCVASHVSHGSFCRMTCNASTTTTSCYVKRRILQRPTLSCPVCLRSIISYTRAPMVMTTTAATGNAVMSSSLMMSPVVQLRGTLHALRHVIHTEGMLSLWSGLSSALAIAVPSTVFYYTLYDHLLEYGNNTMPSAYSFLVPMVTGSTARIIAASIVSPLELIRTKVQAQASTSHGIFEAITKIVKTQGIPSLFRGLNATLARDVPFSAIYWTSYEMLKEKNRDIFYENPLFHAFVSGGISGALAATITTPFDVIKTLQQIDSNRFAQRSSARKIVRDVVAAEGIQGLMTGWGARLAKICPACAIMISSYEASKLYFCLED